MQLPQSGMAMTALVILVCAIIGGALTAYVRLAEKNTPFDTGLLHGRAGAAAAMLLLVSLLTGNEASQNIKPALGLLALTILGGTAHPKPARTTVGSQLLGILVEIDAIAYVGEK